MHVGRQGDHGNGRLYACGQAGGQGLQSGGMWQVKVKVQVAGEGPFLDIF